MQVNRATAAALLLVLTGVTSIGWSVFSYIKKDPPPPTTTSSPTPAAASTPAPWTPVCVRATENINEYYLPLRDARTEQITDWQIKFYKPPIQAGKNAMLVDGDVHEWSYSSQPLYKLVWQSSDDPLLARHPMNKKSQHQWVVAHLVHRINCAHVLPPPSPGTSTPTPTPAPGAKPDTSPPSWSIPLLNAKVMELRFFECGLDMPKREHRGYAKRFRAAESRYIGWEMVLSHRRVTRNFDWNVREIYYRNEEVEIWRNDWQMVTQAGWFDSYVNNKYGSTTPGGTWTPGNYRVDIWVENKKVASGTFELY